MADGGRRTTLASSGLPVPSSVARMRPPSMMGPPGSAAGPSTLQASLGVSAGRYSLAPQRVMRQSSAQSYGMGGLQPPATVGRSGHTYGGAQLGMSGARGDAGFLRSVSGGSNGPVAGPSSGRASEYVPPSARRSSVGRRQSSLPGQVPQLQHFLTSAKLAKDPRPVRDRAFMARCQSEILDFLSERGYPDTLSTRTLATPTGKEFASIFKFLFTLYDPSHRTWGKKLEDDVMLCLRAAGYPFAESISKSHIQAVGNMHSWPNIVAMLHWLVVSIQTRDRSFDVYGEVCVDPDGPMQADWLERPQARIEIWAEFLVKLYPKFLASEDYDLKPNLDTMHERYEQFHERSLAEQAAREEQAENLRNALDQLNSLPNELESKQKEASALAKDVRALDDFMLHLDKKSKQLIRSIDELKVVIAGDERAEVDRQRMREKLKRDIEQQGLSEVEIQRLTTDRMQLDDQVRQHTAKLTETMQDTLNTEIELARAQVAAERLVDDYTGRATRLGVLPIPPAGFEDIAASFVQELNPSAAVASEIAPTAALGRIRPALLRMKTDVVNARKADVTAALEVEADLVQLSERVSDMLEHLERADERYGSIMDHLTSTKEAIAAETAQSNAEMERTDRKVTELRDQLSGSLLNADQRLQALDQDADVVRIRAENAEAFTNQLEAIIGYKQYVSAHIEELLQLAREG